MRANSKVYPLLGLAAVAVVATLVAMQPSTAPSHAAVAPAEQGPLAGLKAMATEAPTTTLMCVPPPNGMLAWWQFELLEQEDGDPPSPAFYADLAGVQNVAAIGVAPEPSVGRVGNGLHFDGEAQFLEVAHHPELDLGTADFTIDAWVRLPSDAMGFRTIVDKRSFSPVQGYALFTIDGQVGLQLGDASAPGNFCSSNPAEDPCTNYNSGVAINDNEWHFVAVSVSRPVSATRAIFYIDGESIPFNAALRPLSLDNAAPLRIGQHAQEGAVWKGDIDEVELYGRALDESELDVIYQAGPAGKCPPEGAPICPAATPTVSSLGSTSTNDNPGVPIDCLPQGARELVNIDAVNQCGGDATGFRFTLSEFQNVQYNANSVDFNFGPIYETPPPLGIPGNPFTPPQAKPKYDTHIVLEWRNKWPDTGSGSSTGTNKVVGNATPAHFGYTLNNAASLGHTVRADWLRDGGNSAPPCFAVGEAALWAVSGASVSLTLQNPPSDNSPTDLASAYDRSGLNENVSTVVSPTTMTLTIRGLVSQNRVRLDQLASSNDGLLSTARVLLNSATLAPGEAVSVTLPTDRTGWGVVVIADWRDGQTNALLARSFRARPFTALLPPTALPSSVPPPTATATPTSTESSPARTPSSTPTVTPLPTPLQLTATTTPSPSPTPFSTPEQTVTAPSPTMASPTDSATPILGWLLYLPALRRERSGIGPVARWVTLGAAHE